MKLSFYPFKLRFKHPFGISSYTRTSHTTILTTIEHNGIIGYGEASTVPYLGETEERITHFLSKVDLSGFHNPENIPDVLKYVDQMDSGNAPAKTGIDIALHDLLGKVQQKPCHSLYNVNPDNMPLTSYTIGIDTPEMVRKKVKEVKGFQIFKIKLGSGHDREIIKAIREETDAPVSVDANQGWKDRSEAIDMIHWLKEKKVLFIEQPMDKADWEGNAWITEHSPLPIIADEAMQRLTDLDKVKDAYNGINIKLMKCTGLYEGYRIIEKARTLGLKIMIGCMSETSCAIMAAASMAPLVDYADLDSPWLVTNNPFQTPNLRSGKIVLNNLPGLGISEVNDQNTFNR